MAYKDKNKKKEADKRRCLERREELLIYKHKWYLENIDKVKNKAKKYQREHKEEINLKARLRNKKKPYLKRVVQKRYREKNKEILKQKLQIWRKENPDKYKNQQQEALQREKNNGWASRKKWKKNNEGKIKIYNQSQNAKESKRRNKLLRKLRKLITNITPQWLTELWNKTTRCELCNKEMENNSKYPNGKHLDHILPICVGGQHMKNNVRFICAECNISRPKDGRDLLKAI